MYPCKVAMELLEKYGQCTLREICDYLEIHIVIYDLPENIEGFFQNINDVFIIFVNENVIFEKIDSIIAHELGHILLHSELNTLFLEENTYFVVNKFEREADLFAATILTDQIWQEPSLEYLSSITFLPVDIIEKVVDFRRKYEESQLQHFRELNC